MSIGDIDLQYSFLSLSDLGIRVVLTSSNEVGSFLVLLLMFYLKFMKFTIISFLNVCYIALTNLDFSLGEIQFL